MVSKDKPIAVLDTAAFLSGYINPNFENYTVPEVLSELESFGIRFDETYYSSLVNLAEPNSKYVTHVMDSAIKTGDYRVLSKTDLILIGLALQLYSTGKQDVTVFSDDYAVANLARFLGLNHSFVGLRKDGFRLLKWVWFCPACHRVYFSDERFCVNCGSQLKRKPK